MRGMKRLLLVAAATFLNPVHAGGCDEETIRGIKRGRSVVTLDSGGVFEVEPDDTSGTALWNAGAMTDRRLLAPPRKDSTQRRPHPAGIEDEPIALALFRI
jgi:hypothetical protein